MELAPQGVRQGLPQVVSGRRWKTAPGCAGRGGRRGVMRCLFDGSRGCSLSCTAATPPTSLRARLPVCCCVSWWQEGTQQSNARSHSSATARPSHAFPLSAALQPRLQQPGWSDPQVRHEHLPSVLQALLQGHRLHQVPLSVLPGPRHCPSCRGMGAATAMAMRA